MGSSIEFSHQDDPAADIITATFGDGSQVNIWIWESGHVSVSRRNDASGLWGIPVEGKMDR